MGRSSRYRMPTDGGSRRPQDPWGGPEDRLGGALACISFGLTALVGGLWPLIAPSNRRHLKAATVVRCHGVGMGVAAILTLWAQAANDWPIWAIPAIWGPLALLLLASMVALVIAALRGDLDDDAPSTPRVPPPLPPSSMGRPGGTATGAGSGHS
jgi:hypothetical protein